MATGRRTVATDADHDTHPNDLASRVLRYLARYPQAADSVDGVARFWLVDGGPCHHADVRASLEMLVERGWVDRRVNRDGTTVYCASPALRARIRLGQPIEL